MTSLPTFSLGNYLPEDVDLPEGEGELKDALKVILEENAKQTNRKDTGSYEEVEQLINQQFFGANPQTKRYVYRKVFDFGPIASGATLNIGHGINGITEFTRLYGTAITDVPDDRPIPYADTLLVTNQISIRRNGINIVVTNGATAPNIVSGLIIAEFVKQ